MSAGGGDGQQQMDKDGHLLLACHPPIGILDWSDEIEK